MLMLRGLIGSASALRFALAGVAVGRGDLDPFVTIGFSARFPLLLCLLMLAMPPSGSSEGILMRIATILQLILIVFFPAFRPTIR
jgi:hypothetical protein